jgi:trehalose 6-phosphate synthase
MGRLIAVSNRVPALDGEPAAGGLATGLSSASKQSGGIWFGWSGETIEGDVGEARLHQQDGTTYVTVNLTAADYHGYYEGYSNQILWPLFHYRVDLAVFERSVFQRYHAVNEQFADQLLPLLQPEDVIWVHDYHLIPLGEELRRRGCRQRIGFFLHTPFPAPEILVTLFNHKRLVRSLLFYDLVGFQTPDDLRSFRDYIVQELRDGRATDDGCVSAFGESTKAGVFPIGVDPEAFGKLASSRSALRYGKRVRESLGGCKLIVSVDRLDYSKGLLERLDAVEMLFELAPELRRQVSFLQIASPSREDVPQYQAIRQDLESAVGQINGRFADSDWTPVRYVSKTFNQSRLCGLYRLASVGLVNSLRDGMNLVAKEFVAAQDPQDPGVLVLSRFAGAAHQMPEALVVNPYDKADVSQSLRQALEMPLQERIGRWTELIAGLRRDDISAWRESFLQELTR